MPGPPAGPRGESTADAQGWLLPVAQGDGGGTQTRRGRGHKPREVSQGWKWPSGPGTRQLGLSGTTQAAQVPTRLRLLSHGRGQEAHPRGACTKASSVPTSSAVLRGRPGSASPRVKRATSSSKSKKTWNTAKVKRNDILKGTLRFGHENLSNSRAPRTELLHGASPDHGHFNTASSGQHRAHRRPDLSLT